MVKGEGVDDTLPKAKRLMIDSKSMADSVSVIVPPGARFLSSAPGASAMIFVPDQTTGFDRGDRVRGQADILFHLQANDGSKLGIKVNLFHPSDWNAGDEDLASWFKPADVCESGVHLVGGPAKGHARAGLHCEPNDNGDSREEQTRPRTIQYWIASCKKSLFLEAGPECNNIVAKASHNAIV